MSIVQVMAVTIKNWRVKFGDGMVIHQIRQSLGVPQHPVTVKHTFLNNWRNHGDGIDTVNLTLQNYYESKFDKV